MFAHKHRPRAPVFTVVMAALSYSTNRPSMFPTQLQQRMFVFVGKGITLQLLTFSAITRRKPKVFHGLFLRRQRWQRRREKQSVTYQLQGRWRKVKLGPQGWLKIRNTKRHEKQRLENVLILIVDKVMKPQIKQLVICAVFQPFCFCTVCRFHFGPPITAPTPRVMLGLCTLLAKNTVL